MAIYAEPANATSFKALVDLLCSLDDSVAGPVFTWSWGLTGLSIKKLVDSGTVFADIFTDAFSSYKVERELNIGVSVRSLQRIFANVAKTDVISFECGGEEHQPLIVRITSKNQLACVYDLQLVAVAENSLVEVPENMDVEKVPVDVSQFAHIIRCFHTIDAKFIDVKLYEEKLEFKSETMMCTGRHTLPCPTLNCNGAETRISLGRIRFILKLCALVDAITIGFKQDTSLHVSALSDAFRMQFIIGAICREAD